MVEVTPPRVEGTITVAGRRRLAFAEFGDPHGRTVFWLHGTPGARRQIPEEARVVAQELGIRLIGIDRPGVGGSTPHLYDSLLGFAADLGVVADRLGVERFALVGLSGGGAYVLAAAHALPDRVAAAGVLGGVAPTRGEDAPPGGVLGRVRPLAPLLSVFRVPLSAAATGLIWALRPFASPVLDVYARFSPEGDRRVFARPEMKAMFIDDLLRGTRTGMRGPIFDAILFLRPWGFSVRGITTPVRWWHGDADHIVPLAHAERMVSLLPDAELYVRPGESHLGTLGIAQEILTTILDAWDGRATARLA